MFGNWATGSVAIVITPTMTVRIAITIATIGRRMKKFAMLALLRFFVRRGIHQFAFFCLVLTSHHDAFFGLQPGCDHPERAHSRPDFHATDLRAAIGADDSDLIRSLLLIHRRLRHHQCSSDLSGWRLNACVLARSQEISGVGELAHDLNRSGLRVYLAIREDDSAEI